MLRKGKLIPLACCLALFGLTACSDDDAVCGNGVAEKGELCDLQDLKGNTCSDVVPGSTGILACSATCTFDTGDCASCGDGVRQFGEQCDCGTDAANLPANCTDVNGGADANCSNECEKIAYCGDGVQDTDEDCDCGTDAANLPTGCDAVNGAEGGSCTADCEAVIECNVEGYWQDCDPLTEGDCCADDWGVEPICATLPVEGNPSYCMRECSGTLDCFWSSFCFAQAGNICYPEICSPVGGWPNTEVNDYCTVSGGGGQGWCWPVFSRTETTDTNSGICVEAGALAHGDACPVFGLDSTDRSEPVCNMGFCGAAQGAMEGNCMQFCDWEAAYDVAIYGAAASTEVLPCPNGANCFAESMIDGDTGIRSGDLSYCYDTTATDATDGMDTCSLVTNQLLADPTETCATIGGYTNGLCVMVQFSSGDVTNGALVGVCVDSEVSNKDVWELCDDAAGSTDVCPPGSLCLKPDVFGDDTDNARCVPLCDTAHADGIRDQCENLGAIQTGDGTPVCKSQSLLYPPDGPADSMKTRLGLCVY